MTVLRNFLLWLVAVSFATVAAPQGEAAETEAQLTPEQLKFFESKIRPVLVSECYGCHSKQSGQARGGLNLDTRNAMLLGGDSGPSVVPGSLEDSLLFSAINHDDFIMPPKRKLSGAQIADFRKWILDGAPDPRVAKSIAPPNQTIDDETIEEAKQTFWAYQEPRDVPPSDEGNGWAKTDVDLYVFDGLKEAGLAPAKDTNAGRLLRRLCFDLVGLPPTPEQVQWFENAYKTDADAAVEHVTKQLMEKPQFGEHWGRHWLDVVRYAESTGREVNMTYPNAWRYRDYVIDAFNADKPYDEFVQEQLAGDLLPAKDDDEWTDNLIATGFLAIGTKNVNEQSGAQFAADVADEQIDATTRVFLGTSVACARCHDHKFDPIRQTDYYAMAGIFRSTKTFFGTPPSQYGGFVSMPQLRRPSSLILLPVADPNPYDKSYTKAEMDEMRERIEDLRGQLAGMRRGGNNDAANAQRMRIRLTNQISEISNKLGVVDDSGRPRSYCMGVQDQKTVGDAPLFVRGEIDQPADKVRRDVPTVLSDESLSIKAGRSGRLELARWIGSDQNTLAARVMVNRVWNHIFGQGIVPTTEDFGMTGTYPSHPELLDHLTLRFIESGWSVKTLVRDLVQSRAYRMDSTFNVASHERDPDNRLLWRSNVKRLPAESIRDAMLSIADTLETDRPRGSMVAEAGYTRVRGAQLTDPREQIRQTIEQAFVNRREELRDRFRRQQQSRGGFFRNRSNADREEMARMTEKMLQDASLDSANSNKRSVYLPIVRDFVPRSLEVFDFADPSMVTGVREASNTPNQALFMMNNPLTLRLSDSFAERVLDSDSRLSDRVEHAFVLAYGRAPSVQERKASMRFLSESGPASKQAFAAFCQSLFAAAEFRYLN